MYKTLLILKYLRKRRIAWVSLIAVTMCTALVLVVISVMGGWLRMFRQSFHGLQGDIQMTAGTQGIPYYADMIQRIEGLPIVGRGNAVPVVRTFGLLSLDNPPRTDPVQVLGYPIDKIGNVNAFDQSLFRQHQERQEAADKLKDPKLKLTPEERDYYTKLANDHSRPTFNVVSDMTVDVEPLPKGLEFPPELKGKITYLPHERKLIFHGAMTDEEYTNLLALSSDPAYQEAIEKLHYYSDPQRMFPRLKTVDVREWPGMIVGDGVANIHKDKEGNTVNRSLSLYRVHPKLTVIAIPDAGEGLDVRNKMERQYWIVDDSRTKVYQYDSQTVYVPFDVLQRDLQMDEKKADDGSVISPARASEINIKLQPGADLAKARDEIQSACAAVYKDKTGMDLAPFVVQTWEDANRTWLHAIENEKVLVTFLFSLISLVAVFLIFCIFYMIVVEKTRDIGIIKSVGATNTGVAGIFLGYGLVIGVAGSALGFLFGWLIVHYINQLHTWLGRAMGIVIWDPQVYLFDKIPNTMNPVEVAVILGIAIVSAVLGALVPAYRAARLHPVEALRWE